MDSIKKFFEKKKADAKFKIAGQGKKLTSAQASLSHSKKNDYDYRKASKAPSTDSKMAGAAALARFEQTKPTEVNWSLQAIKAQARREMELEKQMNKVSMEEEQQVETNVKYETNENKDDHLAVDNVYFQCPLLGPDAAPYEEIKSRIKEFLFSQLGEDKGIASCLIIHTCNKNKEKVNTCVETICKYIENILSNPTEEKYCKIRISNKAFQERVHHVEGTREFMEGAGFTQQELPFNDSSQLFWVMEFPPNEDALSNLNSLQASLVSAEPIKPQLHRSPKVMFPKDALSHANLPKEFYSLSAEEIKREQALRTEAVEQSQMLMTKTMREKMEVRELKKYRFTIIRIRFPDGLILQGTFGVNEKFSTILEFIREHLVNDWRPFFLLLSGGGKVNEEERSLVDLRLVPSVILNFEWDQSITDPDLEDCVYLKEETILLLQK